MTDVLIQDEIIFKTLFERDLPIGYTVASELAEDSIDHLPFVLFSTFGSGLSQNGPGLWPVSLVVSVFGSGKDEAGNAAKEVDRVVRAWGTPGFALVPGMGSVESVDDESKFSSSPSSDMLGKNVSQYDGSYLVALRSPATV